MSLPSLARLALRATVPIGMQPQEEEEEETEEGEEADDDDEDDDDAQANALHAQGTAKNAPNAPAEPPSDAKAPDFAQCDDPELFRTMLDDDSVRAVLAKLGEDDSVRIACQSLFNWFACRKTGGLPPPTEEVWRDALAIFGLREVNDASDQARGTMTYEKIFRLLCYLFAEGDSSSYLPPVMVPAVAMEFSWSHSFVERPIVYKEFFSFSCGVFHRQEQQWCWAEAARHPRISEFVSAVRQCKEEAKKEPINADTMLRSGLWRDRFSVGTVEGRHPRVPPGAGRFHFFRQYLRGELPKRSLDMMLVYLKEMQHISFCLEGSERPVLRALTWLFQARGGSISQDWMCCDSSLNRMLTRCWDLLIANQPAILSEEERDAYSEGVQFWIRERLACPQPVQMYHIAVLRALGRDDLVVDMLDNAPPQAISAMQPHVVGPYEGLHTALELSRMWLHITAANATYAWLRAQARRALSGAEPWTVFWNVGIALASEHGSAGSSSGNHDPQTRIQEWELKAPLAAAETALQTSQTKNLYRETASFAAANPEAVTHSAKYADVVADLIAQIGARMGPEGIKPIYDRLNAALTKYNSLLSIPGSDPSGVMAVEAYRIRALLNIPQPPNTEPKHVTHDWKYPLESESEDEDQQGS